MLVFSENQQRVIASAATLFSVWVICWVLLKFTGWITSFASFFSGVFLPLASAAVLALILKPFYKPIHQKVKHKGVAVAVVYACILVPLIAFGCFFGFKAFRQISDLVEHLPMFAAKLKLFLTEKGPIFSQFVTEHELDVKMQEFFEKHGMSVADGLKSMSLKAFQAFGAVAALLGWAVLPVYLAFFLMVEGIDEKKTETVLLPFLKEKTREDIVYLVREFITIIVAFFRGQMLVAFCQGILFAIGFSLIGLKYGFVLGMALGFLNIIPYLGSMIGLGVTLPLALFQNAGPKLGWGLVGLVVVVFTIVQLIEGYLLTPKIMGDKTGLHPLAIMVALFFWGTALDGITGMILAIPLTAFLVVFWRLARTKYIKELV